MFIEKRRSLLYRIGLYLNRIPKGLLIQNFFFNQSHQLILNKLRQDCSSTIEKYLKKQDSPTTKENLKEENFIWVCWWQGLDQAPELVKECIKRIKKNCTSGKVIVLTKDNYLDFVEFPKNIQNAINKDRVSINHITDLLRVNLLASHGGIWIDSTVFTFSKLNESIFESSFFSLPLPYSERSSRYVSKGRWSGFLMGCCKESRQLFQFISECMEEYFSHNDQIVTYFFLDYLLEIAYENDIHNFRESVNQLEVPTHSLYDLNNLLVKNSHGRFTLITNSTTPFYKLNWKSEYALTFDQVKHRIDIVINNGGQ